MAKLDRPLDFTAVTDHAGKLGEKESALTQTARAITHWPAKFIEAICNCRMWFPYSYRDDLSLDQQRAMAALRNELEPLVEIMQVKGDSECRNGLTTVYGGADELCDFEKLRKPGLPFENCEEEYGSGGMRLVGCLSRFSFVRYALSAGLEEERRLGINPFKLGIVAVTNNHNGTPTSDSEANYMGANGPDRVARNRLRGEVEVPGGIAKGWVDREGRTQQRLYDVAGDGNNGASVNINTCEPQDPGVSQLCSVWQDPDFDATQGAVYYSLVVENPSCRWSTWQCNVLPEEERPESCSNGEVPKTIQERAWTSPIWVMPSAG